MSTAKNSDAQQRRDNSEIMRARKEEADFLLALQSEAKNQERLTAINNQKRDNAEKAQQGDQQGATFHTIKASYNFQSNNGSISGSETNRPEFQDLENNRGEIDPSTLLLPQRPLETETVLQTIKVHKEEDALGTQILSTIKGEAQPADPALGDEALVLLSQNLSTIKTGEEHAIPNSAPSPQQALQSSAIAAMTLPGVGPSTGKFSVSQEKIEEIELDSDHVNFEDIAEAELEVLEIEEQLQEQSSFDKEQTLDLIENRVQNNAPLSGLSSTDISSQTSSSVPSLALAMNSPTAAASVPAASFAQPVTAQPTIVNAVVNTVSQTITEALVTAKETPKGIIVQLDPPEMGRVYVDFLFDQDNAVTVIVKSESADSQAILRSQQDVFQQLLSESGFDSVTMSFEQNDGNLSGENAQDEKTKSFALRREMAAQEHSNDISHNGAYQLGEHRTQIDIRL